MPNLGTIVTDDEVQAIPGWTQGGNSNWKPLEKIIVRAVEAMVQNEANLIVAETTYTQEPYTVEPPVRKDSVVTHPRDIFMLKHAPVTTWTRLEVVSTRNADGTPDIVTELPPSAYQVDMAAGILRLRYSFPLDPSIWPYPLAMEPNNLWPFGGSFPPGVGMLLATYTAGIASDSIPFDLKMVTLAGITRARKKFQNNDFDLAAMNMAGSGTTFVDAQFTKFEMGILKNYKRGYFPSYH